MGAIECCSEWESVVLVRKEDGTPLCAQPLRMRAAGDVSCESQRSGRLSCRSYRVAGAWGSVQGARSLPRARASWRGGFKRCHVGVGERRLPRMAGSSQPPPASMSFPEALVKPSMTQEHAGEEL